MQATATLPKLTRDQQAELDLYRRDIPHWINEHVWTFDPRPEADPHHLPFKLWPFQVRYINWLEERYRERKDGVVDKTRDMGATWGGLAWAAHHWLFDEGFQGLIGSRKEELVDSSERTDTLFWKLEYIVAHLPSWMQPEGWNATRHHLHMKLINPANGNAVLGESANPHFSRQGRYSMILLDEFAFWDWGESVIGATADSAPTRFFISTSPGHMVNAFSRLRHSGRVPVFTLFWREHPHKTEAWHKEEEKRRTPEEMAREVDISYHAGVMGQVYPEWSDIPRGDFPFCPGWPLYASWDFGLVDQTALLWAQRNPRTGKYRLIDCYANAGPTIDWYKPFATGVVASGLPYGYTEDDLAKIESHRGWPAAVHYGDPSGAGREQTSGQSVIAQLARPPHPVYVQTAPGVNTFEARWQKSKLFLRQVEGINLPACVGLDDAITGARFPQRRESSQATSEATKPIHDWTSHYRTALEYLAVNLGGSGADKTKPARRRSSWEEM